ncbi:hypothetical protein VOLCADRAFT_73556 [Volvox carteri f. nagariensis]|uniref:S1 motif domain-containing protein n=1 Tax=Volvox carteri f. nagariensis TaxID=3068 RepID=D8TN51_VOLCA|nr:uncharacterized protein VOLCADRAFT_73556 [Volvox carteri f. nagariensis]EFJ51079.1 hypothetical protein VOLCADRAFT_73556 [Volvox carteri f. nagariensis]|eukprot:XP_002948091.1 hypothetical protein VOLCADRAFT_73556 [Volvox carteri f. nagariensis]
MSAAGAVRVRQHQPGADIALIERGLGVHDAPISTTFVCIGDEISTEGQEGFLRGHGTQVVDEKLVATVCGVVERVNKLIYVRTLNSRYNAEQGDVVVGRVADIAGKAWRVDLKSRQESKLLLSAVHLPGGIQRRRNAEDELNMRSFFREGELISAEVQSVHADGSVALHTRSAKYGKLTHGQLVEVPPNLIKRQKQHFHTLEALGVELIIGCNGLVWVAPLRPDRAAAAAAADIGADAADAAAEAPVAPPPSKGQLEVVCRMANAIRVLTRLYMPVYPASIMAVYEAAMDKNVELRDMLEPDFLEAVVKQEAQRRNSAMQE